MIAGPSTTPAFAKLVPRFDSARMFDTLLPIIVPRSYARSGGWFGSLRNLVHPELAVTWVELGSPTAMTYVNFERQAQIEAAGVQIHEVAMQNLRKQSERPATHAKVIEGRTLFQALMHPDGLGTSRLLLLPEFRAEFPQGFWLAIPERSCGILVPKSVTPEERQVAVDMVSKCFEDGTTPMLPGLFEATAFEFEDAA